MVSNLFRSHLMCTNHFNLFCITGGISCFFRTLLVIHHHLLLLPSSTEVEATTWIFFLHQCLFCAFLTAADNCSTVTPPHHLPTHLFGCPLSLFPGIIPCWIMDYILVIMLQCSIAEVLLVAASVVHLILLA